MAKIELKEMYLTEYNRLINALRRHYSALNSVYTIGGITDYFNKLADPNNKNLDIKLNDVPFSSESSATYNIGSYNVKITKDPDLVPNNIKKGVNIEGVTGTVYDVLTSPIVNTQELNIQNDVLPYVSNTVDYYYYDGSEIKSTKGQLEISDGTVFTLFNDFVPNSQTEDTSITFVRKNQTTILHKDNFSIQINKAFIQTNDGKVMISSGYVGQDQEIEPGISNSNKQALTEKLKYGATVLGVTGTNKNIIDTMNLLTTANSNHIVKGQKYYVNGESVEGSLEPITDVNLIVTDSSASFDHVISLASYDGARYIALPVNHYVEIPYAFDVSNLNPENIKSGVSILGVSGTLEGAKGEEEKTVDLSMASGNQVITPTSGKVMNKVTITKPSTLLAENIKSGVNIGGVVGTYEGSSTTITYWNGMYKDGDK